jgi:type IV secretory pathway component VirB8
MGITMTIRPKSRAKFEKLGLQYVRKDIGFGFSIEDALQTEEAKEWMHEQEIKLERRESWRFWSMLLFTLIAAVAACIAAEPIVKDWIWPPIH